MKAQYIYDKGTDSLAIFTGRRTHASVELGGEIIVDLDSKNNVTGVEILNPDKLFKLTKKSLEKIDHASLTSVNRGGLTWIYLALRMGEIEKQTQIPLAVAA